MRQMCTTLLSLPVSKAWFSYAAGTAYVNIYRRIIICSGHRPPACLQSWANKVLNNFRLFFYNFLIASVWFDQHRGLDWAEVHMATNAIAKTNDHPKLLEFYWWTQTEPIAKLSGRYQKQHGKLTTTCTAITNLKYMLLFTCLFGYLNAESPKF